MIALHRRAWQAGFTLMELMLSLALLALIMIILYGSFHAVAVSKLHAEVRVESDQQARTLMWLMSRELRGAVFTPLIPSHVLLVGQASRQGGMPMDSITFATLDPSHRRALDGYSAEEDVTYSAVPNPNHRGWFMWTRSQRSGLIQTANPPIQPPTVLATNVLSVHFRYFNGFQWLEVWDSTSSPAGQALPQAISIELQMASGRQPVYLSTMISLPMATIQK
ncbi:MAG TPA: type II secretion system protein GspJ [Candidatus Binataceae bacterium]|nr:type II secretion system protein GspJ [Candidatus Binataceae bacterium]